MDITLYGLLHLQEQENSAVNVNVRTFDQQIDIYLQNALALFYSLQQRGIQFILLTNRPIVIDERLKKLGHEGGLKVEEVSFYSNVPSRVNFYSAHFKLDVFRYLSLLEGDQYVGLLDLDMIAIGEVPHCFKELALKGIPIRYDITDQVVPAYGASRILGDMKKLLPSIDQVSWSGGEFITGTPSFFNSLYFEICNIYSSYIESIDILHHQGDEMLTSVALAKLRQNGEYIADGGELRIVGRFWSYPPKHQQQSFSKFENFFLMHFPSDKKFLAKLKQEDTRSHDSFLKKYRNYLLVKLPTSAIHSKIADTLRMSELFLNKALRVLS